jgi:hypothetical protein
VPSTSWISRCLTAALAVGLVTACSLTSLDGYSTGGGGKEPMDAAATETGTSDAALPDAGTTYRDVVLADGPLGYWRLGDTGSVAKDEVGGHDGTYAGSVTHRAGALASGDDGAAVFDGTSFVDIGNAFSFMGKTPFSLEAWIAPDGFGSSSDTRCIAAKNAGPLGSGPKDGYAFFLVGGLKLSRFRDGAEDDVTASLSQVSVFTHVVAIYDGNTIALYANGARIAEGPASQPMIEVAPSFTIGASRGGAACFFRGGLDEVAIYGTPLSSERIQAHFEAGAAMH